MPQRKRGPTPDLMEEAIQRAGSIGALERLAGIGSAQDERAAFWQPYCKMPAAEALDAGVSELKRRIRSQAQQATRNNQSKGRRHA